MTVTMLEHSMSVNELRKWSIYLRDESPDVNEIQNAILSNMIASYMGRKNSSYEDYLIRKKHKAVNKPISNNAVLAIFGALGAEKNSV